MTPAAVMKCPTCRYGMVYRYGNILECERCGDTRESVVESVQPVQLCSTTEINERPVEDAL